MERNNLTILALIGAALLGAAAIGVVLRTSTGTDAPEPEPMTEQADGKTAKNKAKRPKPKGLREVPDAPAEVDGYEKTASGLEYHDIVVGDGESPEEGSIVVVEYSGFLTDGSLFDSSYKRRDPFKFVLGKGQVIKGWDEGVASMKVGGKRQLKVPYELAYGEAGKPPRIPRKATLIFDVELKDVKPPRNSPEAPQEVADSDYEETDKGLKYHVFEEGTGEQPQTGDRVAVDYTGWLQDGTKFDSSLDRVEPIEFPVGRGRVIPGWDQAILDMKVGGKRQLVIPPELAYGKRGRPPVIPENATLIFEVHLVGVK